MEAGSVSITFQDTHDTPVFEPLPGETRLWGDTDVIGLFDAETDMKEVVAILEHHPLLGAGFCAQNRTTGRQRLGTRVDG